MAIYRWNMEESSCMWMIWDFINRPHWLVYMGDHFINCLWAILFPQKVSKAFDYTVKGNIPLLFWKGTVTWLSSVVRVQGITSLDHLPCSVFLLKFIMSWLREDGCRMRMASSILWHVTHRTLTFPILGVGQQANCNKPTSLPNQKCRCLSKVTHSHVRCTTGVWKQCNIGTWAMTTVWTGRH